MSKAPLQRKVITVNRKGKTFRQARMVRAEQAPAHPSHWRETAAAVASVALPIIGGMIGETIGARQGEHHITNFGNRLAEHGRTMGRSSAHVGVGDRTITFHGTPSMGSRAGGLVARGVGTVLAHQAGNIGSMIGGSLGTSLGGAAGQGFTRLLLHNRG